MSCHPLTHFTPTHPPDQLSQFADADKSAGSNTTCGQIEWPGRYVARLIYIAEKRHKQTSGSYTTSLDSLMDACLASDGCVTADIALARTNKEVSTATYLYNWASSSL
jgi:hypothetical protein